MEAHTNIQKPVIMHLIAAMTIAGSEKVVLNLLYYAAEHKQCELDLRVASFVRAADGSGSDFLREAQSVGAHTDQIVMHKAWDLRDISEMYKIIKSHNARLIHSHGYKSDIVGVIAARLAGIPVVATAHGFTGVDAKLRRNEALGRLFLHFCDRVIAVSENVQHSLLSAGISKRKILLIPNAIDFDYFGQGCNLDFRGLWSIEPNDIVVGTAGRLSLEKAQGNLVRAISELPGTLRNRIKLIIAGDGPEEGNLRKIIRDVGLNRQVLLVGFVRDMRSFYQALDLFCLPSLTEGHPLTIMEAAACGVPIVASKVGAITQLIIDGVDGYTPQPQSIEQMARAIEKVLVRKDLGRGMGKALREKLQRDYDISPWAEKLFAIYKGLLRP